jgi:hypothetical protein
MLAEQVNMFNGASMGCLSLTGGDFSGGVATDTFWPLIDNMVHKRNLFNNDDIDDVEISNSEESKVKIAAGTDRFVTRPSDASYIKMGDRVAGIHYGRALAEYMVQDMVHSAILMLTTCIGKEGATLIKDITGDDPDTMNLRALNRTSGLFGDAASAIRCWITHSTPFNDLIDNNLANSEQLFTFGTVSIRTDASGKPFIVTDAPYLVSADVYSTLGLVPGAVVIEGPNNYLAASERKTGKNNIYDAMQSEWTYNAKVKGYSWNAGQNTVASPDDAALGSAASWLKVRENHKLLPGVILKTN